MIGEMMEPSKKDWKLFREKLPLWQESYMEKLVQEYIALLRKKETASDKFWKLEDRIKKDRKHPGVIMEMRKSDMTYDIVMLIRYGVIQLDDLEGFSEELIEQVRFMVER